MSRPPTPAPAPGSWWTSAARRPRRSSCRCRSTSGRSNRPRGAVMALSALRYAKTHEWAKRDGDVVTVGITQYAAEQLGDVTHLQLPKVGAATTAGKPFGEIESVKAVFDLYAP